MFFLNFTLPGAVTAKRKSPFDRMFKIVGI